METYKGLLKNYPKRIGKRAYNMVTNVLKFDRRMTEVCKIIIIKVFLRKYCNNLFQFFLFKYENGIKVDVEVYSKLPDKYLLPEEKLSNVTHDKKFLVFQRNLLPKDKRLYLEGIRQLMDAALSKKDKAKFNELSEKRNCLLNNYCDKFDDLQQVIEKVLKNQEHIKYNMVFFFFFYNKLCN